MTHTRPDPDSLLAEVTTAESRSTRGHLKVFFGSNAGVGKTFAMLDEARKRAAEGINVLVGYAEPHIRPDTEALLLGLDILPYKLVQYKDATLKEFDLDSALTRRPSIICVDELAHSNAPGMRHPKRWQDVQELLEAGINVYATLNVQHLESVNDIVERITGVKVRETIPDRVLDEADELELVDIAPDELIERLREGKIYKQQQAETALKHFFNRGNLIALRELALRKTAERVDAQMQDARRAVAGAKPWAASDRIIACVGPSPFAQQLVRATKRLAAAFRAPWAAVYIEIPGSKPLSPEAQERLAETLRLAEQLGAQTVTLSGESVLEELLAYAHKKNATKIVIGKPDQSRWHEFFKGSLVDELIRRSGQIDIYVIRHENPKGTKNRSPAIAPVDATPWRGYAWASVISFISSGLGAFLYHIVGARHNFSNTNALMLDLLAILLIATRFGRGPATLASLLTVALFDFTVVPPYFSFAVSDAQYLLTFAVMLATGLLIGTLTDRVRRQADAARQRERRTAALLSLSHELAATRDLKSIARITVTHLADVFDSPVAAFVPNTKGELEIAASNGDTTPLDDKERSVISWVHDHREPAGLGTETLPSAAGMYMPMIANGASVGVLGLLRSTIAADPGRLRLLEAFANQAAVALERASLSDESRRAWERVEAEFLRNTLLSSVSHDLRTPLSTITGAASILAESNTLEPAEQKDLARDIYQESERLERLITNLLDMTRLESGGFKLKREWQSLVDIIGSACTHCRRALAQRIVHVEVPQDLPFINVDAIALDQVFVNLLDNAANYTPPATPIDITARSQGDGIDIDIADRGPGLPAEDPQRVFQKFYRGQQIASGQEGSRRGLGLGLAICKSIIHFHDGTITARNRDGGGALFRVHLPLGGIPPAMPQDLDPKADDPAES